MVETDDRGHVLVPHHDGNLDAIINVTDSETLLLYRCVRGIRRSIRLVGVHDISVYNFRMGNIILDATVHNAADAALVATAEHLKRLGYGQASPLKGKFLFILESSYGAEVVADCDDVEFRVGWDSLLI
jgi:hypothetical protein